MARLEAGTSSSSPSRPATVAPSTPPKVREKNDVLVASDVRKSYGRGIWPVRKHVDVLNGVDLTVRAGELVGLVGENGSGKST